MNTPITLETLLAAAVFVGLRISGLMLFAPGFGNSGVPARTKAAFVAVCVALLWPVVPVQAIKVSPLAWAGIAVNELLIGVMVGLLMNLLFEAAQFAGQILGMQMGFSLATMIDPQSQADSPVLSVFHQTIVLLIFFALDVHHWMLRTLVSSFYYLPAGRPILTSVTIDGLLRASGAIWLLGLQIAAPALIATVVADIVLAFIGKASPQLPVLFVGLSIKSVLGMLITIAAMVAWPRFFALQFSNAIGWCEQALHLAS